MNENETARKRAAWLETATQEEFDAFRPLSDAEIAEALDAGEHDRAAAEAQGNAELPGTRILFR